MAINETPQLRERAIHFSRNQALSPDIVSALELLSQIEANPKLLSEVVDGATAADRAMVMLRIGIDNMVANGFEIGYQAHIDDSKPVRALGGTAETRARAARVASKASKAAKRRR